MFDSVCLSVCLHIYTSRSGLVCRVQQKSTVFVCLSVIRRRLWPVSHQWSIFFKLVYFYTTFWLSQQRSLTLLIWSNLDLIGTVKSLTTHDIIHVHVFLFEKQQNTHLFFNTKNNIYFFHCKWLIYILNNKYDLCFHSFTYKYSTGLEITVFPDVWDTQKWTWVFNWKPGNCQADGQP